MRGVLRKLVRRIWGENPYRVEPVRSVVPPPPPLPQRGEDIMAWGVANAPDLFARAREVDRRMREARKEEP